MTSPKPRQASAKEADSSTPKITSHVAELTEAQLDAVAEWCESRSWEFVAVPYSRFSYKSPDVNLVAYSKKTRAGLFKLVVQGAGTQNWITFTLEGEITGTARVGYDEINHPEWFESHAGMDESGKGDLFGSVVCCCVVADAEHVRLWRSKGVQDSKRVSSDDAILKLDTLIRSTPGAVVKRMALGVEKYNELWEKMGRNLNQLMSWQHSKALESALLEKPVPWGLLDQFSKRDWMKRFFRNPSFDLRQRPRAEEDPVVAAASICARAEYVRRMQALSDEAGFKLLKGCSSEVKKQAVALIHKKGPECLPGFVKMHFKTTREALIQAGYANLVQTTAGDDEENEE